MSSYRQQLQEAVVRTEKWNLSCLSSRMMGEWAHHDESNGFTLNCDADYFTKFSRAVPVPPEVRATSCAPVHFGALIQMMAMAWEWPPVITIGDVLVGGSPCFNVNRNSLRQELRRGEKATGRVHIHVWLTFADLTILDLTLIPWVLRRQGDPIDMRAPHGLALLGDPDQLKPTFEHRPMLIGPGFLCRTGTLHAGAEHLYAQAEAAWAETRRASRAGR